MYLKKLKILALFIMFFSLSQAYIVDEKNMNLIYNSGFGDLFMVKNLVSRGASLETKSLREGMTPLLSATEYENINIAKYLINSGANIEAKNNEGQTPLIMASLTWNSEMVDLIFEKGGNPLAVDNYNKTALDYAVESKVPDFKNYVVKKYNDYGYSVLATAAKAENLSLLQNLLKEGFDPNQIDKYGKSAIFYAVDNAYFPALYTLVKGNANLDLQDNVNKSAIFYAIRDKKLEVVKFLMEKGASLEISDMNNKKPIHYAIELNDTAMLRQMINYGAKIDKELVKYAKSSSNSEVYSMLKNYR